MKEIKTARRQFLGTLAAGAAGVATLAAPVKTIANSFNHDKLFMDDADTWFKGLKGSHRMVFDVTRPHEIFPFAWPKVFLMTNAATGSNANDVGVVVVLRHDGIPYAFPDEMWAKYKFGDMFKAMDPKTKAPAVRNPFWKPMADDFSVPGIGSIAIGINDLQKDGVMFCVCDAAMTVYSAAVASSTGKSPEEVKKEWTDNVLPGIQIVPSGVWAVGRAQEHNCAYCFAG